MTRKRVGRRRWAKLIQFLEATMTGNGSDRTRMTAALRLADVLTLREQREQLELKAAMRKADATETSKAEQQEQQPDPETDLDERVRAVFGTVLNGGQDAA